MIDAGGLAGIVKAIREHPNVDNVQQWGSNAQYNTPINADDTVNTPRLIDAFLATIDGPSYFPDGHQIYEDIYDPLFNDEDNGEVCTALLISSPIYLRRIVIAERRFESRSILDRLAAFSTTHANAVLKMELKVDRPGCISELCLLPGVAILRNNVNVQHVTNLDPAMSMLARFISQEDGADTARGLLGPIMDYLYGEQSYDHPRREHQRHDDQLREKNTAAAAARRGV